VQRDRVSAAKGRRCEYEDGRDTIVLVGDLVNKGPEPLQVSGPLRLDVEHAGGRMRAACSCLPSPPPGMRLHGLCTSLLCCWLAEAEATGSAWLPSVQGSLHVSPNNCPQCSGTHRFLTRRSRDSSHYIPRLRRARRQRTAGAAALNFRAEPAPRWRLRALRAELAPRPRPGGAGRAAPGHEVGARQPRRGRGGGIPGVAAGRPGAGARPAPCDAATST